ncbi:hypothetical protein EST38_g8232 [Candolleomyces aberdarensis]|uniref:MYND-type domain-containing protein n=1 Tax=Candolleomyces aberdarensis TaxID=2316362 RepID=A0A4Q2DFC2_9AGAR|nr:hypothetical protein EST38_g8232 [Candolleomyces aberdarensis]
MTKSKKTVNFTRQSQWDCPPNVGLIVTDEMKRLLDQDGFLNNRNGGEKLRHLYANQSMGLSVEEFSEFGKACMFGILSVVQLIVGRGEAPPLSDTETAYKYGYATLIIAGSQRVVPQPGASQPQHLEVLKLLISCGLPVDVPDIADYVALHHCVLNPSYCQEELMRALLVGGANVDIQNRWGDTPLHNAAMGGDALGADILLEHGASIDIAEGNGYTVRSFYCRTGPAVNAVVEKWLVKRSGKEKAALTGKTCDQCGVAQKGLKICSKCKTVQYCSQECQRAAWSEHKKKCKTFSSSASVTVVPFYSTDAVRNLPADAIQRGFVAGLPTDPVPLSHLRGSHIPKGIPPGGKPVVVKIQVSPFATRPDGSFAPMRVYTQKRDLVCDIRRDDCPDAFDRIFNIIKNQTISGLKGYFVADLVNQAELVVKVSEPLAAQSW